jgi:hypothetical protein
MRLKRWNYMLADYEDYEIPDNWSVYTFVPGLDTFVDCAHCGKSLPYGASFTSMEIHNNMGFGYAVCEDCYNKEAERRFG